MVNVVKEVTVAKRREDELAKRIDLLVKEREQMQKDNSVLQQSLAAAASMSDGTDGADIQVHALQAKLDAAERQYTNEIDFLKGQLDSERRLRDELEEAAERTTDEFVRERSKLRKNVAVAEAQLRQDSKLLEEKFRAELSGARAESMRLEDKINQLQMSMTEMVRDLKLARQKEQSSREEAHALKSELTDTHEHLQMERSNCREMEEAANAAQKGQRQEAQLRSASEARVRTLEHETHFLKSQLESEQAHKIELEKAMHSAKERLAEAEGETSRLTKEADAKRLRQVIVTILFYLYLHELTNSNKMNASFLLCFTRIHILIHTFRYVNDNIRRLVSSRGSRRLRSRTSQWRAMFSRWKSY